MLDRYRWGAGHGSLPAGAGLLEDGEQHEKVNSVEIPRREALRGQIHRPCEGEEECTWFLEERVTECQHMNVFGACLLMLLSHATSFVLRSMRKTTLTWGLGG